MRFLHRIRLKPYPQWGTVTHFLGKLLRKMCSATVLLHLRLRNREDRLVYLEYLLHIIAIMQTNILVYNNRQDDHNRLKKKNS